MKRTSLGLIKEESLNRGSCLNALEQLIQYFLFTIVAPVKYHYSLYYPRVLLISMSKGTFLHHIFSDSDAF